MKHALFFFFSLTLSLFAFAQSNAFDKEDHIKITAAIDSLHVSFKSKSFTLNNIHDLDSCLKKNIPEMTSPVVDLETYSGMTLENHRAIIIILDKYLCPVVSERTSSSGNGKPKFSMRMDTATYSH
jgi:hypothetical protein